MAGATATKVAVLMGGISGERDVSMVTGACVARHLLAGCAVKPVEIHADGAWEVPRGFIAEELSSSPAEWFIGERWDPLDALAQLRREGIEVVFNALHGPGGEDGTIQGLLRLARMPFTGPDVQVAAVTMD